MKKAKLTRSLMAAVSIVALSAVMYGCVHSGDDDPPVAMEPVDTDGDGVADADDAFPNDASETADSDGDGVGDNAQEKNELAAAKAAAMAAWEAWEAARDALASITGDEDENPVAYQQAMNALTDAKAAYDAAAAATTSADAEMYQANAEAARDTATMQVAAVVYSRDMEAIGAARMAAAQAAQSAMQSYEAAKRALAAVEAFKALDMASYDMAKAQVDAAKEANDAAMAASNQAADAMLLGDAEAQRDAARTAMDNAAAANTNAMTYAGMVQTAENDALAAARGAANDAYEDAKQAADDARQAADDASDEADAAEAANEGSPAAMDSRTAANEAADAATDAEAAASRAGDAKMAADDAATSAEARGHQATAEEEKGNAEGHLTTAQMKLADAEAAEITAQNTGAGTKKIWKQRAMDANDDAQGYAKQAREAANKADAQADAAEADAARAMRARTDYANANEKAMAARTAANAAEKAASDAEAAAKTASDALEMAEADDATVAVAREQSNIARTAAMGASGHPATANAEHMKAMTAAEEADMYAKRHVIGLLAHANAQDILDVETDVDTTLALRRAVDARLKAVSGAINDAAGMHGAEATNVGDRDQDSSTTGTTASTRTVSASWLGRALDDPATADTDESTMPSLSITVTTSSGNSLQFTTEAAEEDDTNTAGVDESIMTASEIRGLGNFEHGYSISIPADEDATNGNEARHAIVFTDKRQGADQVRAVAAITGRSITNDPVSGNTVTNLGTRSGTGYTGVTYYEGTVAADTDPATAYMGSLNCADGTECTVDINPNTGAITVTGYTFTGSREGRAQVEAAAAAENDDYLAFGVWLIEDSDGATAGEPKSFAAFANGGEAITNFASDGDNNDNYTLLTGTASYTGKAGGVHTAGTSVDWFEGDASLTANFGAPGTATDEDADDDEVGTISGMINNIIAGGVATGDVISLRSADIVATNSAFSGNVRMGAGVDEDNDDMLEYPYNGTWSGNFYGSNPAVADDTTTTDVDEEMAAAGPESVAGTFGVTGTMGTGEDTVTRSYVGAFGAHCSSGNCRNDNE